MDLSVLDGSYQRVRLVENWNSLVWTERYSLNGDFELVSNNIADIMDQLPLGAADDNPTLVAIDDSEVPMVVETVKIEKGKDGVPKITVSGRSYETVLDRRVTIRAITPGVKRVEWQMEATSAAMAAYEVAKTIIQDGAASPLDIMTSVNLLNSVYAPGATQKFPVEPKELYAWMIDTLALGKYGMKSSIAVSTSDVAVIIYQGDDKTTSVVFDVTLDQIETATYLLSKLGYKNTMITDTENGMEITSLGAPQAGIRRRVDYQDLSSEVTLPPGADLTNLTINKGKVALADRLPTALFSGGVAENIGDGYNNKYFLGDIVTLQGEYNLSQQARVAEFVRTHDTTGIKAYPTFEAVTP